MLGGNRFENAIFLTQSERHQGENNERNNFSNLLYVYTLNDTDV